MNGLASKLVEAQQREQAAQQAVTDAKVALDAARTDAHMADVKVSAAKQAKTDADAKLAKLNTIDAFAALVSGHDENADDALNALFAAAVEARAKVAPAKSEFDEKQARVDELQLGYDAALAAYSQAKSECIAAEQALADEIARQEAEVAAQKQKATNTSTTSQVAYSAKHMATSSSTQGGNLAQTGDAAALIGETFAIGGAVLVASGVFLDAKKRRGQM